MTAVETTAAKTLITVARLMRLSMIGHQTRRGVQTSKRGYEARPPHAAQDAVRDGGRHRLACPGHWRQLGDLLALRSAAAAAAARRTAARARQPGHAGTEAGIEFVQRRRPLRNRVQLSDVSGPRTRADGFHRPRRASTL